MLSPQDVIRRVQVTSRTAMHKISTARPYTHTFVKVNNLVKYYKAKKIQRDKLLFKLPFGCLERLGFLRLRRTK
jgi:hypothetical protein